MNTRSIVELRVIRSSSCKDEMLQGPRTGDRPHESRSTRFNVLSQGEPTVVTELALSRFRRWPTFIACPLGDLAGGRTENTHTKPISDYWRNDDS